MGGSVGKITSPITDQLPEVTDPTRWMHDIGGAANAASNAKTAATEQATQAAGLQAQLLQQPKQISPDNFLATKNRMLNNMRLGLASTITSGAGTPSPVLSAPALTGAPGKKTLGS